MQTNHGHKGEDITKRESHTANEGRDGAGLQIFKQNGIGPVHKKTKHSAKDKQTRYSPQYRFENIAKRRFTMRNETSMPERWKIK